MMLIGLITIVLVSQVSADDNCEKLCKHLSSNYDRHVNCLWDCEVLDDCKKCEAPRCADKPDNCDPQTEKCRDTSDGRVCVCRPGFKKRRNKCVDIDECAKNKDNCDRKNQICVNKPGTFKCKSCPPGKIPVNNKCEVKTCQHIKCGDHQVCKKTAEGPKCKCVKGYYYTGTRCKDIDECAKNKDNCDRNNQICVNEPGTFKCKSCPPGKIPVNNKCEVKTCHHIKCGDHQVCEKTAEGPKCKCVKGYYYTGTRCKDIDECAKNKDNCDRKNQICVNEPGTFKCKSCPPGKIPVNNKCEVKTCQHIKCGDHQVCEKTAEGPKCKCVKGYYYTGTRCKDIDECAKNKDNCDRKNQICVNEPGTFKCKSCPPGKIPVNNKCEAATKCPQVKCHYNEYCYTKTGKCYPCKLICKQYRSKTYLYNSCYSYYCNGHYGG